MYLTQRSAKIFAKHAKFNLMNHNTLRAYRFVSVLCVNTFFYFLDILD